MRIQDLADDDVPRFAGTDDHHVRGIAAVGVFVLHPSQKPVGKPADKGQRDHQEHVKKVIALRNGLYIVPVQMQNPNIQYRCRHIGKHKVLQLRFPRKGPERVVQTKQPEHGKGHSNRKRESLHHRQVKVIRDLRRLKLIADQKRHVARQNHAQYIVNNQDDAPPELRIIKRMLRSMLRILFRLEHIYLNE